MLGNILEREVVLLEPGRHEELHRAGAEGSVALDRGRDDLPAQLAGQLERGDLAPPETGREVPEGPFSGRGFVDRLTAPVAVGDGHEVRAVRAPRHAAQDLDGPVVQRLEGGVVVTAVEPAELELVEGGGREVADRLEAIIVAQNAVLLQQRELKRIINMPELPVDTQTLVVPTTPPDPVDTRISFAAHNCSMVTDDEAPR